MTAKSTKSTGFDLRSTVQRAAKKDAAIQVFVTAAMRERVNAAAHDQRISMSEFIRRALETALGPEGEL